MTQLITKLDQKMNLFAAKLNRPERRKQKHIDSTCIGYSSLMHWAFFKKVLSNTAIKDICVLGVYYSRDIAYMSTILKAQKRRDYTITGVDKFEDSPGNDWSEDSRSLTWEQAGFGQAPAIEHASSNLTKLELADRVKLHSGLAETFLDSTEQTFDFIYIDISHDYETTLNTIKLAAKKLKPTGLIGGDDFSDQGNWGVATAVNESFKQFDTFYNWLWLAHATDYRAN